MLKLLIKNFLTWSSYSNPNKYEPEDINDSISLENSLHSVLRFHSYAPRQERRMREILHDRPGHTGFCARTERQKNEIILRHKIRA